MDQRAPPRAAAAATEEVELELERSRELAASGLVTVAFEAAGACLTAADEGTGSLEGLGMPERRAGVVGGSMA